MPERGRDARDAYELAVAAIGRKERTVAELREHLGARGVDPGEAEAAVARLLAIRELDDERFAHRYADDKRELRGWGPERIRDALVERGIEFALAEAAAGGEPPDAQAERAAAMLAGRSYALDCDSGRGKALAYLGRRGFDYEVAYRAVRLAEGRRAA